MLNTLNVCLRKKNHFESKIVKNLPEKLFIIYKLVTHLLIAET